jgi:predicted phosphodiesterase
MKVLIIGDVHGAHADLAVLLARVRDAHGIEAAIQLGDFGFQAASFAGGFAAGRLPVPVYAIDGNHDDHAWLHRAVKKGETKRWQEVYNLYFQPRASTVRLGGSSAGFLGGALHVDRPQYKHWFRDIANFIMSHERARATHLFNHERPALIVTHSCPADIGIGIQGNPEFAVDIAMHVLSAGFDPGPEHDCGEIELARLWQHLHYRPAAWVFGHFHQQHDRTIDGTRFLCGGTLTSPQLPLWETVGNELFFIPRPATGPFSPHSG